MIALAEADGLAVDGGLGLFQRSSKRTLDC
jgi:hypothetical protein